MKTKSLVLVAIFVAFICIVSPFSLYLGTVPITLGLAAVSVSAALLGSKKGVIAVLIYLFIGAVGLPVFAGFSGGFQVLWRHTGGFLLGYIPCAFIVGLGCERFSFRGRTEVFLALGFAVCNLCGAAWYSFYMNIPFFSAVELCIVSFLLTDVAKLFVCSVSLELLEKTKKRFV